MKQQTQTPEATPLHTQGEWETEYTLDGGIFINSGERCICFIQSEEDGSSTPEDEANAELIVKAVNERKALLDANKDIKEKHSKLVDRLIEMDKENKKLLDSRSELAKALQDDLEFFEEWNGNGNYTERIEKIKQVLKEAGLNNQ